MNNPKNLFTFFNNLIKRELVYNSVDPTHALLIITYRCSSRCEMCTLWKRGRKIDTKKELTLEDWKNCIDTLIFNLKNLKVIEFFGGDFLMRNDFSIPLIEHIMKRNENIIVDFPTNCNMLNEDTARALVKAGAGRLYISLDGPADIHDTMRGRNGTFDNVQNALRYLVKIKKDMGLNKPEIIVNCTISSSNVDNFEQIIPLVEKIGVDTIEFEYVGEFKQENIKNTEIGGIKPTPFYINSGNSNLLSMDQAHLLKKKIKDIRKIAKNSKINIFTQHIDVLTIDDLTKGTIPNKKCYLCRYTVSIDPTGNVIGCFHYNNYIYGNIKDQSFTSIWLNKKHRDFLKAQKKGEIKICQNCISGVHRNPTFFQSLYRMFFIKLLGKGFDE